LVPLAQARQLGRIQGFRTSHDVYFGTNQAAAGVSRNVDLKTTDWQPFGAELSQFGSSIFPV
jgi:hypothetical protein